MKNLLRSIPFLLISLSITICLISCKSEKKCTSHTDDNNNGFCDVCNTDMRDKDDEETNSSSATLIEDGEAKFQIVLGSDVDIGTRSEIDSLKATLKKLGITVNVVDDTKETIQDCEVLVGTVTTRGEQYALDKHRLGYEGYAVEVMGSKIVIQGGGLEGAIIEAIQLFTTDILGIDEDTEELDTVTVKAKDSIISIQDGYEITSIKIGENDLKEYNIAADTSKNFATAATNLQSTIYKSSGYWLPIVSLSEAGEKSIIVRSAPKDDTPKDSYRVYVKGSTLYIESEYANCVIERTEFFATKYITSQSDDITLAGKLIEEDRSVVYYEDFGAKGDGKTDDTGAIKKTHQYANSGGQTVKAKASATYYMSNLGGITIKTNTDWRGATFIIDDTNLHETDANKQYEEQAFTVSSDYKVVKATAEQLAKINAGEKLGPHTTKLDLGLGYPALAVIYNKDKKVYIRYGGNANDGAYQHELVELDKDGNIQEGTELLLDYDKVTSIEIYRCDDEAIEIKNGTFKTLASKMSTTVVKDGKKTVYDSYFKRNITIKRSNTTLTNVKHYVEGEITAEEHKNQGKTGPCYTGFFAIYDANNVTLKDCVLSGRRYYGIAGTYDFSANTSNNILLKDCDQQNYYIDGNLSTNKNVAGVTNYWGIGGTSYCKNMVYDGCLLSRFDAHAGLYRGKILNSHVGMVNLIGGGDFLIENSTVEDNEFISLRTDYGATWDGTITIKDTQLKNGNATGGRVVAMLWTNHDFGYTCHLPNFILDNVSHSKSKTFNFENTVTKNKNEDQEAISTWGDYIHIADAKRPTWEKESPTTNINPLVPPEFIIVKNCPGITFTIEKKQMFNNTKIRGFSGYPAYDPKEDLGI